jgi:chromosome segregation ATPase
MNKIPLELVTTLSNAPAGSPILWNGQALVVSTKPEYNLDYLVRVIGSATKTFDEFVETHRANLQQIPQVVTQIGELRPSVDSANRLASLVSGELGQLSTNISSLASQIAPLDVRVSSLSNSVTAFRTSNQESLSAISSLDARVRGLESAGGLVSRMAVIESQYAEIDRRIAPLETSSNGFAADIQSLNSRITSIEGRIQTIESNIQSILAQMK